MSSPSIALLLLALEQFAFDAFEQLHGLFQLVPIGIRKQVFALLLAPLFPTSTGKRGPFALAGPAHNKMRASW